MTSDIRLAFAHPEERSHASASARWLREQVKISAAQLPHPNPLSPS
jgi:hypothetical protein